MPLPLILIGGAAVAGLIGAKKSYDAYKTNEEAQSVTTEASQVFDNATRRLEACRDWATTRLADLGRLRLLVWDEDMANFVTLFEQIKNVELTGEIAKDSFARAIVSEAELLKLREISVKAGEIVGGGLGAVGAGALAGVAAYGGAMTFGAASTGAAISGLTGVAATNATLAWLGGGSLAAGGMGMAGGMMVLGGLVAGPALLVGGWALSAKAEANLAKARANLAEAKLAAEEMSQPAAALKSIANVADQYVDAILRFRSMFFDVMDALRSQIGNAGTSFPSYSREQKELVWLAVECAGVMKKLIETPLLRPDGALNPRSSRPLDLPDMIAGKMRILQGQGA